VQGAADIRWYRKGRFLDPLEHGELSRDQLGKLHLLVSNVLQRLPDFNRQVNSQRSAEAAAAKANPGKANRAPKEELNHKALLTYLEKQWLPAIRARTTALPKYGTLDGELSLAGPYAEVFRLRQSLYLHPLDRTLHRDAPDANARQLNPQDLFLATDALVQVVPRTSGGDLGQAPIHLLAVGEGAARKWYALPLSPLGLEVMQGNLTDVLTGSDPQHHSLTASHKANEPKVVAELALCIDGERMPPLRREYNVVPITAGRQVALWPDFTSAYWDQYFLYSELPMGEGQIDAAPFFMQAHASQAGLASRPGYTSIHFAGGRPADLDRGEVPGAQRVVARNQQVVDNNPHHYEVYRSPVPFAGVEIRRRVGTEWSPAGFLVVKGLRQMDRTFRDPRTLPSAVVGIDFGSNNTCVSYSVDGERPQPVPIRNRRLLLVGSERPEAQSFSEPSELLFFQREAPLQGQMKSYVHLQDPLRVAPGQQLEAISGGIPVFGSQVRILGMSEQALQTDVGIMKYDLKWTADPTTLNARLGFLKSLWVMICAELYENDRVPQRLRWAYPSALLAGDVTQFAARYQGIAASTPVQGATPVQVDDQDAALTESEAVCAYTFGPGGLALHGDNVVIGIDVGGSTSDVQISGRGAGPPRLLSEASVRLAAGRLGQVAQLCPALQEAMVLFVQGQPALDVPGLAALRERPTTAPYYFNALLDRLRTDDAAAAFYRELYTPQWPQIDNSQTKAFIALPVFISAALVYHAGQLAARTAADHHLAAVRQIDLCTFGKGGRVFDWLAVVGARRAATCYQEFFRAGYGDEVGTITLNLRSEMNRDRKSEVSFGLTAATQTVDMRQACKLDLVGESGIQFDHQALDAAADCRGDYLRDIAHRVLLPTQLRAFEAFANVFFRWVGPDGAGFLSSTTALEARLPEVRTSLINYVTCDSEFQKAVRAAAAGGANTEFGYHPSLFVLEAMCFLDRILIPQLFPGRW
jgi:hypothetical protein